MLLVYICVSSLNSIGGVAARHAATAFARKHTGGKYSANTPLVGRSVCTAVQTSKGCVHGQGHGQDRATRPTKVRFNNPGVTY